MLEQEIASAIKFILERTGNPTPYYRSVPKDFLVPAAYFPPPEITSGGDTLLTYSLSYTWFVKFFHRNRQTAYDLGLAALTALQGRKNVVPLIGRDGQPTGRGFRLKDPALKIIDDGAVQLTLMWDSPRPYDAESSQKMMTYSADVHLKEAYEGAVNQLNETEV